MPIVLGLVNIEDMIYFQGINSILREKIRKKYWTKSKNSVCVHMSTYVDTKNIRVIKYVQS